MIKIDPKPHTTITFFDCIVQMDKGYKVSIEKRINSEGHQYVVHSGLDGDEKRIVEGYVLNHVNTNGI